jgi:penicillin-binding protein 1C
MAGCLLRLMLVSMVLLVILSLCAASFLVFQYYRIAKALPDIENLRQRASQFETTRILDRNGNVLYEILDPQAGRRTYTPLDKISPFVVATTIATEDKGFYSHPGFDVTAIFRAFMQNYQSGGTVSGASTITQQLARTLLFTPQERSEQSYQRKLREAILAAEITRRYTKDEILELYLNEIYYGNLAYGVEAASETYFDVPADKLTLGQAAFLAGLPQAPAVYDIYTNRDMTLQRMTDVLTLTVQTSQEQGCIFASNNVQRICVDPAAAAQAESEIRSAAFRQPGVQMKYPHWVNYVRSLLEQQFDAQTIYRSGFTVYTTLDPGLQDIAQQLVKSQVDSLAASHVTDGALVAVRPSTGEILAMVGSADFNDQAISGEVNMAVSPRQPGSSIKPLTYAAAFEKGWTPTTLIWDVPTDFPPSGRPDDPAPPYHPVNYDGRFHGPVTVRSALANSYNIPAVKALEFIGIYDDPFQPGENGLIAFARRMGITTLNRSDYGLSLTLGGGDVTLLELTGAYAIFANNGVRVPPVAITRIQDYSGKTIYEAPRPAGQQVIRSAHAYLISSILSDIDARIPAFGADSVLNLPFPAAVKTGTTNDFHDNWTMGYTPDLAVGVWMGNADYTPMQNTTGLTGAAPVWSEFMKSAVPLLTGNSLSPFSRPGDVVEKVVCTVSGTQPSQWCPGQSTDQFASDQPPLPPEQDLWKEAQLDTWTGLLVSEACKDFSEKQLVLNVTDPWGVKWIKHDPQGEAWATEYGFEKPILFVPPRECRGDDPRPNLVFAAPREGETIINNPLVLLGVADATQGFDYYQIDVGEGPDPLTWFPLERSKKPVSSPDVLYSWDLSNVPPGVMTLRLYLHSTADTYAERKLVLNLQPPTPTPTNTPLPTPTFLPTETPLPTWTIPPTLTQAPTLAPPPTFPPPPPTIPLPDVSVTPAPAASGRFPKATPGSTSVP